MAGELRRERRLIAKARRGNTRAVAELYRMFAGQLYQRVLLPLTGDADLAADALAETFHTALERLDQFEFRGKSIYGWLARIARNKAMDAHRARARTRRAMSGYKNLIEPLVEPENPEAALEESDTRARMQDRVREVLGRLNPRYRKVIELRFFEDKSREKCAEAMDVKIGTLDVLVLRALRAFRKEWTGKQDAGGEKSE